jgi:copper(I)-binding protein
MSSVRRRAASAALVLLVPLLAACGFGAQTDRVYQAAAGTNNRDGVVDVLNAVIVSDTDGEGTFAGTLVNKGDAKDTLVSVTGASGTVNVELPPGQAVNLATEGQVRLQSSDISGGVFVPLTLQFSSGQTTKIDVPVFGHNGDYANVPVGPTATPSASETPKKKGAGKASSTESPSPTDSATATPTP